MLVSRPLHTFCIVLLLFSLILVSVPARAQTLLSEGFDSVAELTNTGWAFVNTSTIPNENWSQGNDFTFEAQSGNVDSYAYSGVSATEGSSADEVISNWMITPVLSLTNGTAVSFWTRTIDVEAFPDRFEMRYSIMGESIDVGTTPTETGDFNTLLLEINPTQITGVYPQEWKQFTGVISGLTAPANGRIGFRHFVTNGGATGGNGDYIGIDSVLVAIIPEANSLALFFCVLLPAASFLTVRSLRRAKN